jgi:peptidoglycan/LPS O-acetylase OafA/YrhL
VVLVITGIFAVMAAVALRWLSWIRGGWLTVAGALTYPLYLLHQEIGYAIIARLHHRIPKWPLLVGLIAGMLVVAWLVHRLVERPLAPVVKRWLTDAVVQMRHREPIGSPTPPYPQRRMGPLHSNGRRVRGPATATTRVISSR